MFNLARDFRSRNRNHVLLVLLLDPDPTLNTCGQFVVGFDDAAAHRRVDIVSQNPRTLN